MPHRKGKGHPNPQDLDAVADGNVEAPASESTQQGETLARIVALEAELATWKDKATRARADYDNLQKRIARDGDADRLRHKARVLEGFLPLAELARMAAHQAVGVEGNLAEGVAMMAREFDRLLEREGVTAIADAGVPFDRSIHEALAEEAMDDVPAGHVARVVQPGYRLGDKVLRHAKVTVAAPTTTPTQTS